MSSYVSYDHLKVIVRPGDPIMRKWECYYGPELLAGGMMVLPFAIEEFYPQTQATEWELAIVRMVIGCSHVSDGPVTRFDPREFAVHFRLSLRQIRRKLKVMEEKGLLITTPCYDERGKKTRCKLYDCNPFLDKVFAVMCASDEWQRQERERQAALGIAEDINGHHNLPRGDDDVIQPVLETISVPSTTGKSMSSESLTTTGTSMSQEFDTTTGTSMSPDYPAVSSEISTSYVRALGSNSISNSSNINTCINTLISSSNSNSNGQTVKNLDVDNDNARFEHWVQSTIELVQQQEQEQQESKQEDIDALACSVATEDEIVSREAIEQEDEVEQVAEQANDYEAMDLLVMLQGRSRAALYHISTELHDAQPHSSRTRARTLYNHLLRINQDNDEYTMNDPDLYFSDLMLVVKHHISDKTFRCKDGYGQPNGMPLFFHELRKRVEEQVASVEEMRQQGDYLRMYHERRQISSTPRGSAPSIATGEEVATEFMRDYRAAQETAQLELTNVQVVEHAQRLQISMTAEEAQDMLAGTASELLIEQLTRAVRLELYYEMIS